MASDPWDARSVSRSVHQRRQPALPPILLPPDRSLVGQFLLLWDKDIVRAAKAYAHRVGASHADAADAAQLVRVQMWKQIKQLSNKPETYVRAAIANAVENAFRTEKGGLNPTRSRFRPFDLNQLAVEIDLDLMISVRQWIATLPYHLQQVYQLLYVENRTERDAASIMGVSQPRIHQWRDRLLELGRVGLKELAA